VDEAGFVYIIGRASDMDISGGSIVYPREIEEVLLTHPAMAEACVVGMHTSMAEACVVGMPDARWGESGVAVLVAATGAMIDEAALRAHLEGRLARYKWPSRFVVWPELPKPGYGKVTKREVKQRLEEST
jgi:fatty-acyl-CoA synthase